jgi:alpha-D-ribose 1-methylphosphonate 5-triphosphate diphosphatase PhnM
VEPIRVNVKDLTDRIQENRDKHREEFEKAIVGFKIEAEEALEKALDRARKGLVQNVYVSLTMPQDHTPDYDRVLTMLKMTVDDTLELTETDAARYVLDDWEWKQQWVTANASYLATSGK